ncbi:MAG: hypothetical protein WCL00_04455 [Bacteroidota bacterium]
MVQQHLFSSRFTIIVSGLILFLLTSKGFPAEANQLNDPLKRPVPGIDTLTNDLCNMIAGYDAVVFRNKSISKSDLAGYRKQVEKDWSLVVKNKIDPISKWRKQHILPSEQDSGTLFYPFAGADFLYANTFFPGCRNYILIGLEPVGKILRCDTMQKQTLLNYLGKIRSSLYFSNNLGFFRTESMEKELNQETLDGTLPLIAFYIKKTHHEITSITYFVLDSAGSQKEIKAGQTPIGVKVDFCDSTSQKLQTVYYFSVDLSDSGLKRRKAFMAFVKSFGPAQTFLKAASYLMFNSYFHTIRNYILENSKMVLQDDSGIPFRNFNPKKWEVQLYGTYTRTIDLFEHKFQEDLEEAYLKQEKPNPVPFRIGYNVKFNETNLLKATLKK